MQKKFESYGIIGCIGCISNGRMIRFAFGEGCAVLIPLRYITFDEWKDEISPCEVSPCGRNDGRFARKKEGGEAAAKPPPHHPQYHQWHGVISTVGRNLQNYKNDNLKCTHFFQFFFFHLKMFYL